MRAIGLNDLMPMVIYYGEKHHDGDQAYDRDYTNRDNTWEYQ
jgi:hypothetical protein